ncbi:hypothetical protein LOK49_LG15G00021 [Camellia lanceoleosa]|uniref:Uncharacterized protein n=1 Tax=Camellia lanceoleosa TaxID=1840588 RepID=A0ACC0F7N1_9ERIC|nr:hypothetical protein LOK49_LG15G00021 [Camellia lanceoleosa]
MFPLSANRVVPKRNMRKPRVYCSTSSGDSGSICGRRKWEENQVYRTLPEALSTGGSAPNRCIQAASH